ncbi:VOC family protein [Capsulimonas corticalis]|uniref:VOC family protein n=1 Tax=Capsulimonas corticalis TaxID=2219043 RepID=UPI000E649849
MAEQTRIQTGHVGLNVTDLARAKAFYESVFGFQTIKESTQAGREYAFLAEGDTLVLTLWRQSEGRFAKSAPGLHHLSFMVPDVEAVRVIESKARAAGAPFAYDGVVPHAEGAQSGGVFFEDPDGVRLEVFTTSGVEGQSAPTEGAPTCGFF